MTKPIRFRLYPDKGSLHYLVNIWPTKALMIRHLRINGWRPGNGCAGMCSSYRRIRGERLLPRCGEINLYRRWLNAEVVSHEIGHAVLGWARRIGFDVTKESDGHRVSNEEEIFCHALGRMVNQFALHARRKRLWGQR